MKQNRNTLRIRIFQEQLYDYGISEGGECIDKRTYPAREYLNVYFVIVHIK